MQTDNLSADQLTVHLIDTSTMTWAVVQDGNRVHEGSFEMCEEFLDWHQNTLLMQSAETGATPIGREFTHVNPSDERRVGQGLAAFLDGLFSRPRPHATLSTGE